MRIRTIMLALVATTAVAVAVSVPGRETAPAVVTTPAATQPRVHAPSQLPSLAAVETATETDRERLHEEAYRTLVAALRDDPATLAELERFLAEADPSKLSTQIAIGALVAVGTPAMQEALVRLVGARADDDAFARGAIPVMGFLARPTIETEQAIRSFTAPERSEAMQTTAHLTLGIMATQLSRGEAPRANAIVADYATRLASAESPTERSRWLQVLGNARTEAAATVISTQLASPDPVVRRGAVEALRLAPSASVEPGLASALADRDPDVRASAAWSLSHRKSGSPTIDAMLARLAVETDDKVASALLTAVWPRRAASDRVRPAIEHVARTHPSSAIRERAQRLLETV